MNNSIPPAVRTALRHRALRRAASRARLPSPVLLATTAIVLMWLGIHLRRQTPILLGMLAAAAGVLWLCRHRTDIVFSSLIAAVTTAVPGLVVVIAAARNGSAMPSAAAVLTGHIFVGPIPALTVWMLRPAVLPRVANAAVGSAILLAAAAPVAVFGDHGFGPAVLLTGLTAAVGTVVLRHRRAVQRLLEELDEITPGWTDLGERRLPGGRQVHLMVGRGHVLCAVASTGKTIGTGLPNRSVAAAIDTAHALRIPAGRVRPVVLATGSDIVDQRTGSTRQGRAAVTVVPSVAEMAALTTVAPRTWLPHRRVLATAAALSSIGGRS